MANPLIVNPYAKRKHTPQELAAIPDLRPDLSEAGKGIRAFVDETQATGHGVLALGAQKLKDVFDASDEGFLARQVKAGQEGYARNIREATAGRQAPKVARVEDIEGIGSAADYAAYTLAKGIPQLGTLALGGGVGAGIAKATVKKELAKKAKAKVGEVVTQGMKDSAKAEIKKRIGRGAMGGGFVSGAGFEGGHAFGQALEAGVDPSRAADAATVVGGINGALEFVPFFSVAKKLGRGDFAKKSIRNIIKNDAELSKRAVALATAKEAGRRAGGAGLTGAGTEGLTEGLQELVSIAGLRWAEQEPMFADLDPEDWSQIKNAIAAGTLIGFAAGGAGGVFKGPSAAPGQAVDEGILPGDEGAAAVIAPITPVEPGTDPKLVGKPIITPQHPERKQLTEAEQLALEAPGQAVAQVPGLEQKPLQGELVDEELETGLTVQGDQAQLEQPFIEGKSRRIEDDQVIEEQRKLVPPQEQEQKALGNTYTDGLGVRVKDTTFAEGVDAGIADNLQRLNDAGFETNQSMSGLKEDYEDSDRYSPNGYMGFAKETLTPEKETQIQKAAEEAGLAIQTSDIFFSPSLVVRTGITNDGKSISDILQEAGVMAAKELGLEMEMRTSQAFPSSPPKLSLVDHTSEEFSAWLDAREPIRSELKKKAGGQISNDEIRKRWDIFTTALTQDENELQSVTQPIVQEEEIDISAPTLAPGEKAEFRVAAKDAKGTIVEGEVGNIHGQLTLRFGSDLGEMGFVDQFSTFYSREEALNKLKEDKPEIKTIREGVGADVESGLDAGDLQALKEQEILDAQTFDLSSETLASQVKVGEKIKGQNTPAQFTHDFSAMFNNATLEQATESGLLSVNETSPEGSPAGLFNKETNQITINLDRIGADETPMSVLLHEGRHAGMQNVLGDTLPLFHQDLLNLADRGNVDAQSSITRSTGAVADLLGIEHGLYDLGLSQSELEAEVKAIRKLIGENERGAGLLQEEDLAYYIQDAANTTDLTAPGLFRRIMNTLKVWWAQSGTGQMFAQAGLRAEFTPEMAVELAKEAIRKATAGQTIAQGEGILASEPIDLNERRKEKELNEFRKEFHEDINERVAEYQEKINNEVFKYLPGDTVILKSGRRALLKVKTLIDDFREPLPPFSEHKARREIIKSRPKIPGYVVQYSDPDGEVTTTIAEWGITSKATGPQALESVSNPLGTLKRWWGASTDTPLDSNNVTLAGKFRAHIIDNLATITEKSEDVHKVAEVAKSKTSAEQSKINRLFLEPLVQMAKATGLNQEKLDEWLLARHVLLDDENWQNTQKRSWMVARDLAKVLPKALRLDLDKRRVSLTKDRVWIDKEGKSHKIPKAEVQDRMIDLVNEHFKQASEMAEAGTLGEQFTAWKELQDSWIKIQAHSGGLYSPGKVDANGQLLPGQPKRANVSNAPDAYDIFHSYNEDKVQHEALQTMAKKWDEMTGHQLDLLVEGGKITDEEAIAMRGSHPHYVKSRRTSSNNDKSFEFLETGGAGGGKPKVRAGTIEYDPVVHVMQNTIAQAHSNAAAAQQNQAALYLFREVIGNEKHWDGWFTKEKEEIHHLDTFGFLHDRPTSRPEAFDIPVTIMSDDGKSGKTVYLRPVPQNQKAKLFAAGMNKLGVQNQGAVAKVLGLGNKIVRNMAVTFSPAFLAANIFRDPATALFNLQATEGKDYTKDFLLGSDGSGRTGLGNAWRILNSVYTNRDNAKPEHVKWVEEWEHAGGKQSFTQALKEMDEGWKSFESSLAIARTPGLSHAFKGLEWVEKYNIIVENISRFSAYSTVMEAWERGDIPKWDTKEKAQREAAIISKELTTNFDRKGFSSQAIGLWHLFFNATVQGNVQVIRNLAKSKKLQKMVVGTVVASTMFDLLGRMMADDDDEGRNEWDNIPGYIKDRNIILPFKIGGVYVKIPAPWVYNSVWRAGGMLGELAAEKRDTASVPVDMGLLLMNTFNPMASASLLQSLSPTILDPFVQAVENKNFAGNPIKPTSFPGAAALPESQLYWNSTPKAYIGLAQTLNALTGGDVAKSGFIDISPGVIHNYVNFFTAGVGKAVGQVYELGEVTVSDREFDVKDVPILSTYAFTPGTQVDVQLYHDRVAQILQAQKAVDLYGKGKTRDREKQQEARARYKKELRLVKHVKDVERQLKSLRARMRAAQGRKDSNRVKQLKTRITSVQQRFNKRFEQQVK